MLKPFILAHVLFLAVCTACRSQGPDAFIREQRLRQDILQLYYHNGLTREALADAISRTTIIPYKIDLMYLYAITYTPKAPESTGDKNAGRVIGTGNQFLYNSIKSHFYPDNAQVQNGYNNLINEVTVSDQKFRKEINYKDEASIKNGLDKQYPIDMENKRKLEQFISRYGWVNYRRYDTSRNCNNKLLTLLVHYTNDWNLFRKVLYVIADSAAADPFFYEDLCFLHQRYFYQRTTGARNTYAFIGAFVFSDAGKTISDNLYHEYIIIRNDIGLKFEEQYMSVFVIPGAKLSETELALLKKWAAKTHVLVLNNETLQYLATLGFLNLDALHNLSSKLGVFAVMKKPTKWFLAQAEYAVP